MLKEFLGKIKLIYKDKSLSRRILFVLIALVIFRVMANIPIPGVDHNALAQFLNGNQFFGLLNVFSGGVLPELTTFGLITNITIITAGSVLLMWVGEMISEFGIGNGVSLIIFAGIIAGLPTSLQQLIFTYDPSLIPTYIAFVIMGIVILLGVVTITEAERPVPVTYAKQQRGNQTTKGISTYIPLRLNQSGVMPIIFGLSILLLPQMLFQFLGTLNNPTIQSVSANVTAFLANQLYYGIVYFLLVFLFTYFYTAVTFDPDSMAKNLQKSGAFIPGVRPGESTANHIGNILSRVTLVGALFLGSIAVLPVIVTSLSGFTSISIGGTALLIAVSVVIDLIKKIDSQVSMREY